MTSLVVDACAVVDAMTAVPPPRPLVHAIMDGAELHVPEHFHIEVLSALRRLRARDKIDEHVARQALGRLEQLRVLRHPVLGLHRDIWTLRHTLSAYDAAYLALARRLDARLLTTDRGLAAAAEADGRLLIPG